MLHVSVVDHRVELIRSTGLRLRRGARQGVITASELSAASSDPSHAPADVVYRVVSTPRRGHLLLAGRRGRGSPLRPADTFTQADVDAGRVYAQHHSGREIVVVLWLSDGLHFVTGSLVVRATEPFVAAGNGTAVTVVSGQSAVVSADNLGFATNIDADTTDIVFQVSNDSDCD